MKKLFVIQPMNGYTEEEVMDTRRKAYEDAKRIAIKNKYLGEEEELELIDQYHVDPPEGTGRLWLLGRSIQMMETADFIYFAGDWRRANGCLVENYIIRVYRLKVLNEGRW